MNDYLVLLSKINGYLKGDDVISNSDVISVYDLLILINNSFEDLRSIYGKNSLINKINRDNFLTSKIPFIYHNKKTRAKCKFVTFCSCMDKAEIWILLSIYPNESSYDLHLLKDYDNEDIYFRYYDNISDDDRSFVKKYYEEIMHIFHDLEKFRNVKYLNEEHFENEFLEGNIYFDRWGRVDYGLSINGICSAKNICFRQFLDGESIDEGAADLLKKIPVDIDKIKSDYVKEVVGEESSKNYIKLKQNNT